jgi:putative endonuclease
MATTDLPPRSDSLPMGAFVYILLCADRSYYVGSATGDELAPRVAQHNSGFYGGYTSTRRPVELAWSQHLSRSQMLLRQNAN